MATEISANKQYGGWNRRYKHASAVLGCDMTFTVYFPPASDRGPVPVIFFLSGLTCTDENFIQKSGAQKAAAELGIALIAPDTSPRGLNIEGESENWDFGVGAGFYLNATVPKWKNWQMYDYIMKELPQVLKDSSPNLNLATASIMGHSMGGHGALTLALKNPGVFKSVSAFAPICNPTQVPWGVKAFTGYLGPDPAAWQQYDATQLIKQYDPALPKPDILIDTGSADKFYTSQLKPENLQAALLEGGWHSATVRLQPGYDHSYFFISTFVGEHVQFHAKYLKPQV